MAHRGAPWHRFPYSPLLGSKGGETGRRSGPGWTAPVRLLFGTIAAMRRWATIAALGGAAAAAGACGTTPPDLLVLTRSGTIPGAGLRLLVRDDGDVRCNGGARRRLSDSQLLDAREIARELAEPASKHLALPGGRGSVLRYRVRLQDGTVSFSDDSRGQTREMFLAQRFSRSVATGVCGLPR